MLSFVSSLTHIYKFLQLTLAWRNGTLANHSSTVLKGDTALVQTVEVQGCSLVAEIVNNVDLNSVANVGIDGWAGPLAIDADEGTSVSVRGSVNPSYIPVEGPHNCFRVRGGCCFGTSRRG